MSDGTYWCKHCDNECMGMPRTAYLWGDNPKSRPEKLTPVCECCKKYLEEADLAKYAARVAGLLTDYCNGSDPRTLGEALSKEFNRQHRYLQNEAMRALAFFFQHYGDKPETHYDLRNEWAVSFAKRCGESMFPPQPRRLICENCGNKSTLIEEHTGDAEGNPSCVCIPNSWTLRKKKMKDGMVRITYECPHCTVARKEAKSKKAG